MLSFFLFQFNAIKLYFIFVNQFSFLLTIWINYWAHNCFAISHFVAFGFLIFINLLLKDKK